MTPERRAQLRFMADHYGLTESRVAALLKAGKNPADQVGSMVAITVTELNELLGPYEAAQLLKGVPDEAHD